MSDAAPEAFLRLDQVGCERADRCLFQSFSLLLRPGQACRILGDNGAGKTTLMRGIAGLNDHLDGRIERPESCLYLGHRGGMSRRLSVFENLQFRASLLGLERLTPDQAEQALAGVRLEHCQDVRVGHLSAGQARRVGLALLYLPGVPALWLLDEPFTALDQSGVTHLCRRMREHLDNHGMILFTSHQEPGDLVCVNRRLTAAPGEAPE